MSAFSATSDFYPEPVRTDFNLDQALVFSKDDSTAICRETAEKPSTRRVNFNMEKDDRESNCAAFGDLPEDEVERVLHSPKNAVATLGAHSGKESLQEIYCRLLSCHVGESADHVKIVEAGGVEVLVSTLRAYPKNVAVQTDIEGRHLDRLPSLSPRERSAPSTA